MQLITDIALIVGVLVIIASWVVAVRVVKGNKFAPTTTARTAEQGTRQDVLAGANGR